ncbi:MAG: nucleotidyltransferase domain-containing protein [Sulfuricella sp.]|nr:nucleotidyltransferase domain-containing protein [Sulfuricella sp.]
MLSPEHISEAAQRLIAQAATPVNVILFGSYASGEADDTSDLDLMVLEYDLPDKAAEYLRHKGAIGRVGVGGDILLLSPQREDAEITGNGGTKNDG